MKDYMNIVETMLTKFPEVRDDDMKLFACICKALCPQVMRKSFAHVIWYHSDYDLPSFETIRRTRQKLQHDKPELRGKAYEKRMEKQSEYIEKFGRRYS